MSSSPYEKVAGETRIIEKIGKFVPGFRGYKLKELRREADRLVRNQLYEQLTQSKDDLKLVLQRFVDNKWKDLWTDMDRLIANVDTIASEINHASYGYSGFFDAVKIQERELDAMLDYDTRLFTNTGFLDAKVKQLKGEVLSDRWENARTYMRDLRSTVNLLDKLYNERKNVILGV